MTDPRCVLCDQPAGEGSQTLTMTPAARAAFERRFPGVDPLPMLATNVACARCAALPNSERSRVARGAIFRQLGSQATEARAERMSRRIDVGRAIESAELTDETWAWLGLVGDAIMLVQEQAIAQDKDRTWFESYDDYKAILVAVIAKDINTLKSIYVAMRCEWTHQAATLIRTLCESLITLRYIAQDKLTRPTLFLKYAVIEQYHAVVEFVRWDSAGSKPEHMAAMEALRRTLEPEYLAKVPTYTFTDRNGKERPFRNWCNKDVATMAEDTGSDRLYRLVYGQTSSYVHGTAFSLRTVGAFTARGYDPRRALIDTSTLIRAALVVWCEWAAFCDQELGWTLGRELDDLKERLDGLQAALDTATP